MNLNRAQKICAGFLGILLIYWVIFFCAGVKGGFYGYVYSFLYGLIPLVGGLYAVIKSGVWGGVKSAVGRGTAFIGLGLFSWGLGSMVWAYYNFFLGVAAPYPSLADVYYAPSIFFYGIGIIFLSQALGAKYALRGIRAKISIASILVTIALFSYYFLVVIAQKGILIPPGEPFLKTILDVVYPFGDFLSLSLAILLSGLSFRYLGGAYRTNISALLLGLATMFFADFSFSYTTTIGTYYDGNFNDLLLTLGMFLLTFGLLGFTKVRVLAKSPFFLYPRGPGTFEQIALRIIKEQERILGPVAWEEAAKVPGLTIIDKEIGSLIIEAADKKMLVDVLASSYENFFGRAAREVSTEAIERPHMKAIQAALLKFSEDRGWLETAMPAGYAKSISIEAAELLELFQWDDPSAKEVIDDEEKLLKIQRELADVFIYGINLANILESDVMEIIQEKIAYNEKKYPAKVLKQNPDMYLRIKNAYRKGLRKSV